uniref:Uncharacterized protein n=1 Tax=Octopus bimaculoides TaxID=37653 RepID=A0A0L8FW60_OCTBM
MVQPSGSPALSQTVQPKRTLNDNDDDMTKKRTLQVISSFFYSNLAGVKNFDQLFDSAIKVAKCCYEKYLNGELDSAEKNPKKRFKIVRRGCKTKAPGMRNALFERFVDVRTLLHARLPQTLFLLKAEKFCEGWTYQLADTQTEEKLCFSKKYGVSLKFPNKCTSIPKEQCIECIPDYLKNILSVHCYFLDKFGVDPPTINGDQMPLHQNKSRRQASLFRNQDTFVLEMYHSIHPEFVFKGTGKRPPLLNALPRMRYQWSPKGQLLCTIENLPNRVNMFSHANFAIYMLNDYMVHLMPEVRNALWKRGYVLVIIGVVSPDLFNKIEKARKLEKLVQTLNKIPTPNQSKMMQMLHQAHADYKIDAEAAFKLMWATNAFDQIMHLVGVKCANNIEGSKLFDGDGIEGKTAENKSENESKLSGNLLKAIDPFGEIPMEVLLEPKHSQPNMMMGSSISLVGISRRYSYGSRKGIFNSYF